MAAGCSTNSVLHLTAIAFEAGVKLDIDDMEALNELMKKHHFAPILAHAPYTLNGCSQTEKTREFARQAYGRRPAPPGIPRFNSPL